MLVGPVLCVQVDSSTVGGRLVTRLGIYGGCSAVRAASSSTDTAEGLGGSQVKVSEICCERMAARLVSLRICQCAVHVSMSQCSVRVSMSQCAVRVSMSQCAVHVSMSQCAVHVSMSQCSHTSQLAQTKHRKNFNSFCNGLPVPHGLLFHFLVLRLFSDALSAAVIRWNRQCVSNIYLATLYQLQ